MKEFSILLFLITYILLLVFSKRRAYIAFGSAMLYILVGIVPINEIPIIIEWNVILIIVGTMGIVSMFIESKMPALLADILISKTASVKWILVLLALFAGIISAFIDNVATVLIVVPIAINISKKLNISPVPGVIGIAISSNLQGAATLVGDTTSILLGSYANLNFADFFLIDGKIGLFFIVQAGAVASSFVLLYVYKNFKQQVKHQTYTKVNDYLPTILLVVMVASLIIASFIPNTPKLINGCICIIIMLSGMLINAIKQRKLDALINVLKEIDYFTILLLLSLFIVIEGITIVGVIDDLGGFLVKISQGNIFFAYSIIVWISVAFSAFIDNIPYVATMLPVAYTIALSLGVEPNLLYFGMICGATLGGNLTPIGASANITALGMLRKEKQIVKTIDFMKISVPFTLVAVLVGYILVWIIWS